MRKEHTCIPWWAIALWDNDKAVVQYAGGRRGRDSGAWIVTGGLGALGLLTTDFLLGHGVTDVLLLSRSGRHVFLS